MDPRRSPRSVIDPKVRHVGFQPTDRSLSAPTPVIIPPPRHHSDNLASHPSPPCHKSTPYSEFSPRFAVASSSLSVGSRFAAAAADGERETGGAGVGVGSVRVVASSVPVSGLTTVSVFGVSPGITETVTGGAVELQNEKPVISKPAKEKTTKAERRALQEAQRAAKAVARADGTLNLNQDKSAKALPQKVDASSVATSDKKGPGVDRPPEKERKKDVPHPRMQYDDTNRVEKAKRKAVVKQTEARSRVELFRHLPQYERGSQLPDLESKFFQLDPLHPAVYKDDLLEGCLTRGEYLTTSAPSEKHLSVRTILLFKNNELSRQFSTVVCAYGASSYLVHVVENAQWITPNQLGNPSKHVGLQYLSGDVSGGNARCIAMLKAFQEVVREYSTPPEKTLGRDLTAKISTYVSFFNECRPLSVSMGNAIRFFKNRIAKLPLTMSESEAKAALHSDIDQFIGEKIVLADKVIVNYAVTKIRDGDVLLTYGSSSAVEMILLHAHELRKKFRVVVVDSRPKLEGQNLLRRLVREGVNCTYANINAISYVIHEVTRVFLGASTVLSNGTVYSRVGTACVAMVAHAFRVPVLVCCETYKFHERVQLDSICCNELGEPDAISTVPGRKEIDYLNNWSNVDNLQLLNLGYDAMPSDYVSMIITDYGMVPPTSVPVIVREYRREHLWG